jgi:hypothetical protein
MSVTVVKFFFASGNNVMLKIFGTVGDGSTKLAKNVI